MATKSYALSKTKVRETISQAFEGQETVKLADVLALFEGKSVGSAAGSTLVKDAEGNVVGKRCSYFGVFMPISEFGKRGENYAYQSKLAESIVRKQRTEAINAKNMLDEQLANEEISVADWKAGLAEIEAKKAEKVALPDGVDAYDTAEELLANI